MNARELLTSIRKIVALIHSIQIIMEVILWNYEIIAHIMATSTQRDKNMVYNIIWRPIFPISMMVAFFNYLIEILCKVNFRENLID